MTIGSPFCHILTSYSIQSFIQTFVFHTQVKNQNVKFPSSNWAAYFHIFLRILYQNKYCRFGSDVLEISIFNWKWFSLDIFMRYSFICMSFIGHHNMLYISDAGYSLVWHFPSHFGPIISHGKGGTAHENIHDISYLHHSVLLCLWNHVCQASRCWFVPRTSYQIRKSTGCLFSAWPCLYDMKYNIGQWYNGTLQCKTFTRTS